MNGSGFLRWRTLFAACFGAILIGCCPACLRAAEVEVGQNSLHWVPANAASYVSILRNRQQLEELLASEGGQALLAQWKQEGVEVDPETWLLSLLRDGLNLYDEDSLDAARDFFHLTGEALGDEVFYYGDEASLNVLRFEQESGTGESVPLLLMQGATALVGSMVNDASDEEKERREQLKKEAEIRRRVATLAAMPELLSVPTQVYGFKLRDPERFIARWRRIETLVLGRARAFAPDFIQTLPDFREELVAGSTFRIFDRDGFDIFKIDREQFGLAEIPRTHLARLKQNLESLKGVCAIGVHEGYLLIVCAPSVAAIEQLGKGPSLFEQPEMARLRRHANSELTAISYRSRAYDAVVVAFEHETEKMKWERVHKTVRDGVHEVLGGFGLGLEYEYREKWADLAEQFIPPAPVDIPMPEPGVILTIGIRGDRGSEFFTYDERWGERLATQKPLTIVDHLGGRPIFAAAWQMELPENVEPLIKIYRMIEELEEVIGGDSLMTRKDRIAFVRDLLRITDDHFLPAIDGQHAIVIDAPPKFAKVDDREISTFTWQPAYVLGVSDPAKLTTAFVKYRKALLRLKDEGKVADDAWSETEWEHFIDPHGVLFRLLDRDSDERLDDLWSNKGPIKRDELPEDLELDDRWGTVGGLGEKVGVYAPTLTEARRLLAPRPLVNARGERVVPADTLCYIVLDWEAFTEHYLPDGLERLGDGMSVQDILPIPSLMPMHIGPSPDRMSDDEMRRNLEFWEETWAKEHPDHDQPYRVQGGLFGNQPTREPPRSTAPHGYLPPTGTPQYAPGPPHSSPNGPPASNPTNSNPTNPADARPSLMPPPGAYPSAPGQSFPVPAHPTPRPSYPTPRNPPAEEEDKPGDEIADRRPQLEASEVPAGIDLSEPPPVGLYAPFRGSPATTVIARVRPRPLSPPSVVGEPVLPLASLPPRGVLQRVPSDDEATGVQTEVTIWRADAMENEADADADAENEPKMSVTTFRSILKIFKRYETRVYVEEGVGVRHTKFDWGDARR